MAGDHKCPVCNSTFTRPQHVARHMRSHTGDRPYKCQHCGDQFARSDLLSRHVNKCHASEKPPTTTAPNRRKGPSAASRATTSKQACDQCVQASLPCDGCNPCSKCISRKDRCTYVKFHRQTAPQGPGHAPPSQFLQQNSQAPITTAPSLVPSSSSHTSLPSLSASQYSHLSQYPQLSSSYSQHFSSGVPSSRTSTASSASGGSPEFLLSAVGGPHAPGTTNLAALGLPASASYGSAAGLMDYPGYPGYSATQAQRESPTPSLTTSASSTSNVSYDNSSSGVSGDMMARFRNAEALARTGLGGIGVPVSSSMSLQNVGLMQSSMYDQTHNGTAAGHSREAWTSHSFRDSAAAAAAAKDESGAGPATIAPSAADGTRGIPFPSVQAHTTTHHSASKSEERVRGDRSEGFSSAFGLLSLDDPAILAGLASDTDPFFPPTHHHPHRGHSDEASVGRDMHIGDDRSHISSSASDASGDALDVSSDSRASSTTSFSSYNSLHYSSGLTPLATKEELKEFWRQYVRTPWLGPGSGTAGGGMFGNEATPLASGDHLQLGYGNEEHGQQQQHPPQRPGLGTHSRRHSRVASLPSMKTPGAIHEWNMFMHHNNNYNVNQPLANPDFGFNAYPPSTPFNLILNPRRHREAPPSDATSHNANQNQAQQGTANQAETYEPYSRPPHHGDEDLRSYEQAVLARKAPTQLNLVPRRRGTIHLGAVGGGLQAQAQKLAQQKAQQQLGEQQAAQMHAQQQKQQQQQQQEAYHQMERPSSSSSSLADAFGSPAMRPGSGHGLHQGEDRRRYDPPGDRPDRSDADSPTPSASANADVDSMLGHANHRHHYSSGAAHDVNGSSFSSPSLSRPGTKSGSSPSSSSSSSSSAPSSVPSPAMSNMRAHPHHMSYSTSPASPILGSSSSTISGNPGCSPLGANTSPIHQSQHAFQGHQGTSNATYRPSFKRLASQTLGPDRAKRALLGPAGWEDQDDDDDDETEESGGALSEASESSVEDARREYGSRLASHHHHQQHHYAVHHIGPTSSAGAAGTASTATVASGGQYQFP